MERKDIKLNRAQYRELLKSALLGNIIREELADAKQDADEKKSIRILESYLLSFAPDFAQEELAEIEKEELVAAKEFEGECMDLLDEYDNDRFWHRLEHELGERDAWEHATSEERRAIEMSGLWPERARGLYGKYHEEFHAHGVDRLRIEDGRPRKTRVPREAKQADKAE